MEQVFKKRTIKYILLILISINVVSCINRNNAPSGFFTYYIQEVQHGYIFYEHYIYLRNQTITEKDSSQFIKKIKLYIDTVKVGKPVISVYLINNIDNLPQDPDRINWPKVMDDCIFSVSLNEDSLLKGINSIKLIKIRKF